MIVVGVGQNNVGNILGRIPSTLEDLHGRHEIFHIKARHGVTARVHKDAARFGLNEIDGKGDRDLLVRVASLKGPASGDCGLCIFQGINAQNLTHLQR